MLSKKEKQAAYERLYRTLTSRHSIGIRNILNKQVETFLQAPSLNVPVFDDEPLQQYMFTMYSEVVTNAVATELANARSAGYLPLEHRVDDILRSIIRTFYFDKIASRISEVTRTTTDLIKTTIRSVFKKNPTATTQDIRNSILNMNSDRAKVIANTEVLTATNFGANTAFELLGGGLTKAWLTSRDVKVRDAHRVADDQRMNENGKFFVGGQELAYPGDPAGSAANIINCRCTIYLVQINQTN